MEIQNYKLETSICDNSAKGFADQLQGELENALEQFDTHCMNDGVLHLQGEKAMLEKVINYIKYVKP